MRTTIDSAGRLVLPKAIREAANLEGGAEVEIRILGDHLEIEPVVADVTFVRKGGFLVAVRKEISEKKLTAEEVEQIRKQIEEERHGL
jgi:AbrB family looped-hinge helix DNA binding protein